MISASNPKTIAWCIRMDLKHLNEVFSDDVPESIAITKLIESLDEPTKELHRLVGIEQKKYDESQANNG